MKKVASKGYKYFIVNNNFSADLNFTYQRKKSSILYDQLLIAGAF
jgi:hypothetical protein